MLRLLLDEHISPQVARGLRRRRSSIIVYALSEWEGGTFLGQSDFACLAHAAQRHLTLVTYDRRTIPLLLKNWAEAGRQHGGVVFVDEKTISPSDIGGLIDALFVLVTKTGELDWSDRVCFLRR